MLLIVGRENECEEDEERTKVQLLEIGGRRAKLSRLIEIVKLKFIRLHVAEGK